MKFPFQTILLAVFIAAFAFAILVFSGIIKLGSSTSSEKAVGTVYVWGTVSPDVLQQYVDRANSQNKNIIIEYLYKDPSTLGTELVSALADGLQPDIVLADASTLLSLESKIYTIPFETYNERLFRDSFVDGASIFLSSKGVLAIPLVVDPLVLYYNKDILAGQNFVRPPTTWTEMVNALPRFLKKDQKGIITQTALPLGEFANVNEFKQILATLFLQTGNPIVSRAPVTDIYTVSLDRKGVEEEIPQTVNALAFYTNFSNPTSELFSWTRTLPDSRSMFLSGRSAYYIGRASELFSLQSQNPNLNFDVTVMLQPEGASRQVTEGTFLGIAVLKGTKNFPVAYTALGTFASKDFAQYLSGKLSLPPVQRDLLLVQQRNPYVQVFFQAALGAFSWPDTNQQATEQIFRDMIQGVASGRFNPTQAIQEGARSLQSVTR